MEVILIALSVCVGVVGITLFMSFLVKKTKKLDSKENFIHDLLPELDCGKCGYPNCEAFSKEVANETVDISRCAYIQRGNLSKIKRVIKKGYYNNSNTVAFVRCKGGKDCKDKYKYEGQNFCWCKDSLHSGSKQCDKACLGCGDCIKVCRFGALHINKKGVAEVIRDKCTGCGACLSVCPNDLIIRIPVSQTINVVCNNFKDGRSISSKCKVGCTSCGLCAKVCPTKAIEMKNGKPNIDREKCISCNKCIGICPGQCISRL